MMIATALFATLHVGSIVADTSQLRNDATAHIGQTVRVRGVRITPLQVLEDSRCPKMVTCVWAGRVRLGARIDGTARELTIGEPISVRGGQITLAAVAPDRVTVGHSIVPRDYRFRFLFRRGKSVEMTRSPH
jgi:hypothetical protein